VHLAHIPVSDHVTHCVKNLVDADVDIVMDFTVSYSLHLVSISTYIIFLVVRYVVYSFSLLLASSYSVFENYFC
jgi:hypothetical protein